MTTLSPFTPGGSVALAVTGTSARALIPLASSQQIVIYNSGTTTAYIAVGDGTVVATTSGYPIISGTKEALTIGAGTNLAAITASSTTSLIITAGDGFIDGVGAGASGGGGGTSNVAITSPLDGNGNVKEALFDSAGNALLYNANGQAVMANSTPVVIASDQASFPTKPYAYATSDWSYAAAAGGISNTTTAVTIKAAAAAGIKNYITGIDFNTDIALGAATELAIRKGAGGTVIWRTKIGTSGQLQGRTITFPDPISSDAAQLLEVVTLTASITGAVYFNATGYIGA